jgi:dolichyl-diphosphooligosaccharide---protein glycosyltransferase
MDLQFLIFVFPAGVILCFRDLRDEHLFVIIYSVMASYFAGVMVRLMLTLTPVVCVASAIALSTLLDTYTDPILPPDQGKTGAGAGSTDQSPTPTISSKKTKKAVPSSTSSAVPRAIDDFISATTAISNGGSAQPKGIFDLDTRLMITFHLAFLLSFFVLHCTWVTASAYSSPSVVLASSDGQGGQNIIDDFREAYYWLRQNTPTDAVVMSWWDYGYQIAGMADRPTLVDNNTWNNSLFSVYKQVLSLILGFIS